MDYNHITIFLDKFKNIIHQKEEIKKVVIKTIEEEINCKIKEDTVKIKGSSIYIESSPIFRSEILIHKKQILNKLKNNLKDCNFFDIK
jgi:hypothetical protein